MAGMEKMEPDGPGQLINRTVATSPELALAKMDHQVVRIADELEKLLKIAKYIRECLEAEITGGLGYKKMGVTDKAVKMFKDLTACMNSVTESQIRFNKAEKDMASKMTPNDEKLAVLKYLKATDADTRRYILKELQTWMKATFPLVGGRPGEVTDEAGSA